MTKEELKVLEKEIETLSYQQECLASQYKEFLSINEDEVVFIKNICFALNIKPFEFVLKQGNKGKYYDENLCDYELTFYERGKVEKTQIIMKRLPYGSWLPSIPKNENIKLDYLGIKFMDDDSNRIMENIKTQAEKMDQVVNQMHKDLEDLRND